MAIRAPDGANNHVDDGNVTFTSDSRVCYLLLLSMMMMDKVMLMVMIIVMLMMATSPSSQTPGSVNSFTQHLLKTDVISFVELII